MASCRQVVGKLESCNDCLHKEVCSHWLQKQNKHLVAVEGFICERFKDRNRFAELPPEIENESLEFIRENLPDKAKLLQLGEECAELSAAIFKLFRKTETNNPTPKSLEEVHKNLIEEIEDVVLSISVISEYLRDRKIYEAKLKRWVERLKERENNG